MTFLDGLSLLSIVGGCFFFVAGSVGMLRLPDVFTRLHALTKADSAGLGLLVLGLALQADAWSTVLRLLLIWMLVLLSSATTCHLIAQAALRREPAFRKGPALRKGPAFRSGAEPIPLGERLPVESAALPPSTGKPHR